HQPANTPSSEAASYRQPAFECRERARRIDLDVYIPGVDEDGVDLELQGRQLIVKAHKRPPVLPNWQAADLGRAQREYRLNVRLPKWVRKDRISADLDDGVLSVHLPRAQSGRLDEIRIR
ncbi:MAG: Hsp20/alpha crystallin family protein, partial [Verrucomicrobia bacterium]